MGTPREGVERSKTRGGGEWRQREEGQGEIAGPSPSGQPLMCRFGRVWVSDTGAASVAALDGSGSLAETGRLSGGHLVAPLGVASAPNGWVFVADGGTGRIAIFDELLTFVGAVDIPGPGGSTARCPSAIEVG